MRFKIAILLVSVLVSFMAISCGGGGGSDGDGDGSTDIPSWSISSNSVYGINQSAQIDMRGATYYYIKAESLNEEISQLFQINQITSFGIVYDYTLNNVDYCKPDKLYYDVYTEEYLYGPSNTIVYSDSYYGT